MPDQVALLVRTIATLEPEQRQRLFDLLAEEGVLPPHLSPEPRAEGTFPAQLELVRPSPPDDRPPDYVLTFDGGSRGNPGWGYGSYAITRVADGAQRLERLQFGDEYTNNEAEYDALIAALQDLTSRIREAGRQPEEFSLEVRGDSALVINQLEGRWKAKEPRMRQRRDRCRRLLAHFGAVKLVAHPREESVRILGH